MRKKKQQKLNNSHTRFLYRIISIHLWNILTWLIKCLYLSCLYVSMHLCSEKQLVMKLIFYLSETYLMLCGLHIYKILQEMKVGMLHKLDLSQGSWKLINELHFLFLLNSPCLKVLVILPCLCIGVKEIREYISAISTQQTSLEIKS